MATPTAEQLTRLRRKTGNKVPDFNPDGITPGTETDTAFTDAELTDIWDEAGGSMPIAVVLVLRELLVNAVRFHDYTRGQTREERSQIFDHMKEAYGLEREALTNATQMLILGMRPVPPVWKDLPVGEAHPDEKNRRHNTALFRRPRYGNWWG